MNNGVGKRRFARIELFIVVHVIEDDASVYDLSVVDTNFNGNRRGPSLGFDFEKGPFIGVEVEGLQAGLDSADEIGTVAASEDSAGIGDGEVEVLRGEGVWKARVLEDVTDAENKIVRG